MLTRASWRCRAALFRGPSYRARLLATTPPTPQPVPEDNDSMQIIYTGAHNSVIKTLKRVSLTTCVMGIVSTPAFLTLGSEAVPGAATVALAGIVLLATCGPTALLHAFTKPYIFTLRAAPRDKDGNISFMAETCTFFSRTKWTAFNLRDVKPLPNSVRPFVTFEAGKNLFFVHGEAFEDKALLKRLVGRPLKPAEMEPVKSIE